jgi:hypothetical protein
MQDTSGKPIRVGDTVVVNGIRGVIVCDFDSREFAHGYKDWNTPTTEMLGSGTLSSGIMIETVEAGLIHCADGNCVIEFVAA